MPIRDWQPGPGQQRRDPGGFGRPPTDRRPGPDRAPGGPPFHRPPFRPDRPGTRPYPPRPPFGRPSDVPPSQRQDRDLAPPDVLGPEEELVAGRRPVEEVFAAGRVAHRLLVVPQRRAALEQIVLHATRLRIPIVELEGGSLTALAGFDGHQGIAVVVEPRAFATLADVLARAAERDEPPFVLVLDSLEDPQNVGTLLRSAEAAGVHGILFPTRRQAPLGPAAVKASAGAVEHLLLCPVDDLAGALADLHTHGIRVLGSEADAPLTARQTDLRGPLAIVVGSEGQGLGPAVRKRCDAFMRIPMRGAIGSLNASVAGSILLFEAVAQRDPEGAASPPAAASRARSGIKTRSAANDAAETGSPPDAPSEPAEDATPAESRSDEAAAADGDNDLLPGGPAGDGSPDATEAPDDPTPAPVPPKRRASARRTTPHA
jgi:23S rRNA (guanosine2251-2'-O)-methyltransferase